MLFNSLYGGSDEHPGLGRGSRLEDPERPGYFNAQPFGAYRTNSRDRLFPAWDRSIPVKDKSRWRDQLVAEAYAEAALASDPDGGDEDTGKLPRAERCPGRQLRAGARPAAVVGRPPRHAGPGHPFGAGLLEPAVDAETLVAEASDARLVTMPQATHFVHLDRAEAGRAAILKALTGFLATPGG